MLVDVEVDVVEMVVVGVDVVVGDSVVVEVVDEIEVDVLEMVRVDVVVGDSVEASLVTRGLVKVGVPTVQSPETRVRKTDVPAGPEEVTNCWHEIGIGAALFVIRATGKVVTEFCALTISMSSPLIETVVLSS